VRQILGFALFAFAIISPLPAQENTAMTARGTFDVSVSPARDADGSAGPIGRLVLEKQFHGDLEAESTGQMLGAGSPDEGSAGYVAMEVVTGTLDGRRGSFVLQHLGSMSDGTMDLKVQVVPGSGTDELAGLSGDMTITIEGDRHSYELEYAVHGAAADSP
jgi:hypothetical protein